MAEPVSENVATLCAMLATALQVHLTNPSGDGVQKVAAALTAVAAGATAWMAVKTRALANKTQEVAEATKEEAEAVKEQGIHIAAQAEASAEALKSSVLPWLTWEPRHESVSVWRSPSGEEGRRTTALEQGLEVSAADDGGITGRLLVRNVGPGIALIDTYNSWVNGGGNTPQRYVKLRTSKPVLPSDQTTWLSFHINPTSAAWSQLTLDTFSQQPTGGTCSFDVYYRDVANASTYRARFYGTAITYPSHWTVHKIDYFEGQSETPDFTVTLDSPI